MFQIGLGQYSLLVHRGPLPNMYGEYRSRASLSEEYALDCSEGDGCFVAVGRTHEWPSLVVALRFSPSEGGFNPGLLLVEETGIVFIGAGTQLLGYRLDGPARLWQDSAHFFWSWSRHDDVVLMMAELEFAAWDIHGTKLWTTYVEPPWTYQVSNGMVDLDVMGSVSSFSIVHGPPSPGGIAPL